MPICHASKNALEISLEVGVKATPSSKESVITLVMSLKRHAFKYINKGEAKEENSVCHSSIDVPALLLDAEDIGRQLQAATDSNRFTLLSENMDFTTLTRRTYRCDNHKHQDGFNHFFPIRGPDVWNCDLQEFEMLQALRRLQKGEAEGTAKTVFSRWTAFQNDLPAWRAMRAKLVAASNDEELIGDLEAELRKPKARKADKGVAMAGGATFGFGRMPGMSLDDLDDSPSSSSGRSRANSNASSGSDSSEFFSDSSSSGSESD